MPVAARRSTRTLPLLARTLACSLALVALSTATRASAAPPTGLPVYVSDQFKAVAVRAARQLGTQAIADACPDNQPLCTPVATHLAEAFTAALARDPVALRSALNAFFVQSSVVALLQQTTRDIYAHETTDAWQNGLAPLLGCLANGLSGNTSRTACTFSSPADRGWTTALFDRWANKEGFSKTDRTYTMRLWQHVYDGERVEPALVARVLAAVATGTSIRRPDLRVYLLGLSTWASRGVEGGLFPATYAYLSELAAGPTTAPGQDPCRVGTYADRILACGYRPTMGALFDPGLDASFDHALASCSDGKSRKAFEAWRRDRAPYVEQLRNDLLVGTLSDFTSLTRLMAISARPGCSQAERSRVLQLKSFAGYMFGSVSVREALGAYGAPALAAAALIDFVRTSDSAQLQRDLRSTLVFGVARLVVYTRVVGKKSPVAASVATVLRSCEFRSFAAELGLPQPDATRDCTTLGGVAGHVPAPLPEVTADSVAKALRGLMQQLQPLLDLRKKLVAWRADFFAQAHVDALARAVRLLQGGDKASAERALMRLGIDLLVAEVDKLSGSFDEDFSAADCQSNVRSRSIFTSLGGACAIHVLLQAAYHPIADYFWQKGGTADSASSVAQGVYRNLLGNPYLDSTPIILNVGLGANYIRGASDVWSKRGYGALTLLDKVGVAVYKYNGDRSRFEMGPFVGGFLDALVRTAAKDGTTHRYWLAGYTAGFTRMAGADFGFEAHIGAAMPFELGKDRYGFAVGGAFVVPFNTYLEASNDDNP